MGKLLRELELGQSFWRQIRKVRKGGQKMGGCWEAEMGAEREGEEQEGRSSGSTATWGVEVITGVGVG